MAEHDAKLDITVEGYEKFGDVARVMGRVDRNFPKWIQKEIEREAKQLQRAAKKSIRGQRGASKKQTGILNEIAAGIGIEEFDDSDKFGWRIKTSMPEENEENLPGGFDTSFGGFGHPVFYQPGRMKADGTPSWFAEKHWRHQDGKYDWWVQVMDKAEPELTEKLDAVLEKGADEIIAASKEKD